MSEVQTLRPEVQAPHPEVQAPHPEVEALLQRLADDEDYWDYLDHLDQLEEDEGYWDYLDHLEDALGCREWDNMVVCGGAR